MPTEDRSCYKDLKDGTRRYYRRDNTWRARVWYKGDCIELGYFPSKALALKAEEAFRHLLLNRTE